MCRLWTRFSTSDEMEQLELEVIDMCISHNYVYYVADLNSLSDSNPDYLITDDEFSKVLEYEDVMINYFNKCTCLPDYGLSVERANIDVHIINDGYFF